MFWRRAAVVSVALELLAGAAQAQRPGAMQERGGCPYNYAPVCGTDGRTHPNRCIASSHRAGVAYVGACRPGVPITCQRGAIAACGADGRTYPSRCAALTAGVAVSHDRACVTEQRAARRCGGRNGVLCESGERCDLSGAPRGRLDAMGVCRPR